MKNLIYFVTNERKKNKEMGTQMELELTEKDNPEWNDLYEDLFD